MGKLGKLLVFTAFLAVLIGIGMVKVQGQGTLKTLDFDFDRLAKLKKIQIEKLRDLIKGDITHEFMLGDAFLLKWLLDQDFDVKQAANVLKKHLEWRADQNLNSILDENWDDIKSVLPYSMNTTDKFGRPLVYFHFGDWDIAKLVSDEKVGIDRLERYFYMFLEDVEQRIRNLQGEGGKNVTQSVWIINLDKFSLEKQGCIQCLLLYRKITQNMGENFPWVAERNLYVNVPYIFEVVSAYMSDKGKLCMNMLGGDKSSWGPIILKTIDREQLPTALFEQQNKIF